LDDISANSAKAQIFRPFGRLLNSQLIQIRRVVSTICDHILATWSKTCSCSAFCPQHSRLASEIASSCCNSSMVSGSPEPLTCERFSTYA
jgi:hypothetical protein